MPPVLNIPEPKKPKLSIWADLSAHHVDQLSTEITTDGKRDLLKSILKLEATPRNDILLDLFLNTLHFAKLHNYKKDQTAALFSIVKQTHEVATSTPFGNMQECFEFFREMMLIHSVHRPPWSIEVFNAQELEEITAHVVNTYFRHYKLYKYAFTPKVRLDLSINYEGRVPSPDPIELDDDEQDGEGRERASSVGPSESQSARTTKTETPNPETPRSDTQKPEIPKPETPPSSEKEEPSEFELLVRKAVTEQIKRLQLNVEKQLEDADKVINEKIQILEQGPVSPKGKKSPKNSAKGRKK